MQANATSALTGLDKMWVNARRNNCWFLTNKIFSVLIATGLATFTASMKPDIIKYMNSSLTVTIEDEAEAIKHNASTYSFIYWLLFIYYSFSALDELIELYAVYFEREKGALGLLLEMNHFLGVGVIIYLTVFIYKTSVQLPQEYEHLHSWVNFQVIFLYICIALSLLITVCMHSMQRKVVRAKAEKHAAVKTE